MWRWLVERVNIWVMLGGILVAAGLIAGLALVILLLPIPALEAPAPQAALTIIAAPTATLTPTPVIETPTPTKPPAVGGIRAGDYVQITGTGGAGLRLRQGPGTDQALRFVGMDSEVFMVKDGPREANGFTWWFLEAPYDPSRSGWAASSYLSVVDQPTPTP